MNDRVISLDLKKSKNIVCIMAVYLLHFGYAWNYFQQIMMDIESFAIEAFDKRYSWIIAGDFNVDLDHGDRGRAMHDF